MPYVRMLLAAILVLSASCEPDADPGESPSACQGPTRPMRITGYAPRAFDVLTLASRDGQLVAWVLRYSDENGAFIADRVGELFELQWVADGAKVPSPPGAVVELELPADADVGLVTRIVDADFDAFEGPESEGRTTRLGSASFTRGLCVRGGAGDDWLEVHTDGPLEITTGEGQDVVRASGTRVVVDAGPGHDTVLLTGAGADHVVQGGPGRDRLTSLGPSARMLGGDDDDCLAARPGVRVDVDGGPGDDRSPLPTNTERVDVERAAIGDTAEGYRWCGPTWSDETEPDGVWDPFAREIEERVMEAIDRARTDGLTCDGAPRPPAPLGPRTGADHAALRWASRMHARDTAGYPPPTSPRFAGDAHVPESVVVDYTDAHFSPEGDDAFPRALRAGAELGPPTTRVFENATRCVRDEPGCAGGAAEVAHTIFEEWRLSPEHCRTLVGFPDAAGVVYAVGVFAQTESRAGTPLPSPHFNAIFLLVEHRAAGL